MGGIPAKPRGVFQIGQSLVGLALASRLTEAGL